MASSTKPFTTVEIDLRSSQSYKASGTKIKLLEARTKWTTSGNSVLAVTLLVKYKGKKEELYLTRTSNIPHAKWGTVKIELLNGDNGYVKLRISPLQEQLKSD